MAAYLTYDERRRRPSLRQIASASDWRRLIAVDLAFATIVLVGLLLFVVPGVVLYARLGLAGSVVELEGRGARSALARSNGLVRGRFWLVLSVLAPIELFGEAIGEGAKAAAGALLGDGLPAEWLASATADVLFGPLLAIGCVLLTAGLIAERDGRAPRLHSAPVAR